MGLGEHAELVLCAWPASLPWLGGLRVLAPGMDYRVLNIKRRGPLSSAGMLSPGSCLLFLLGQILNLYLVKSASKLRKVYPKTGGQSLLLLAPGTSHGL